MKQMLPDSHLLFRRYFLRDQRIAEKGRTEEICKIGRDSGSEGYLPILGKIRRETIHWACSRRFGLDMCQKGKKQSVNRGFYRCVVGPELVQEKVSFLALLKSL